MSQASAAGNAGVLCFLIADIRGYTAYTRDRGDEAAARLAAAFAALCREAVEAHDGTVIELRGDEALATFASPRQALRAATELQVVFADETALDTTLPLNVGIGIDAGEAVAVEGGYRGDALNFAARLCSAAAAGDILASESVARLAGDMDDIEVETVDGLSLKGIGADVRATRIRWTRSSRHPIAASATVVPVELDPLTPIFGRDTDARSLRWEWRRARRGEARTVAVTGPTGVGKTRLAAEAAGLAARDGASVVYASSFGSNVAASLARLSSSTASAVLVVDDVESATDDDLAALRAARTDLPEHTLLIVIATDDARSEVAATLRALGAQGTHLTLRPIADDAIAQIVAGYVTEADGPAPVWAIAQASGGIPAHVHELAATWARQQATQRLGAAAARTADGRRDLRQLESEVASNVIDLQLAQARLNLVGRSERKSADVCPYKGLVAFDVGDANMFYGRERLIAEIIGRLAGANFLAVVGPSGSGKSSAVRAGLLPALTGGALPGAEAWHHVIVRPGAHPLRELDRVLYASISADQREQLSRSVAGNDIAGADDRVAPVAGVLPVGERLLLVVDQFEEVFTIADAGERNAFVSILERAAATDAATIVLALRADFYGRCAAYPSLAEQLSAGHILVGPMSAAEYSRAIEGPARRAGLTIDPALVDALVLDVLDQPGALPLLSTALVELWEKREGRAIRLSAYAATGGVRGAVGRLAEAAFGALEAEEQLIARGLFLRLSAGEGDAVVRRRVPLAELDVDNNPRVAGVVKTLTEARLITVGDGSVEVAHEALLREWPRLAAWLEEDRAARRLREHLVSAARDWDAAGHDPGELYRGTRLAAAIDWTADHTLELNETERSFLGESRAAAARDADRQRRTNRRLRVLLGAAAVALLIALGAGSFALIQDQSAQRTATVADAQRLGAQGLTESNVDLALLLARQGLEFDVDNVTRANMLSAIVRSPGAIGAWRPAPGRPLGVSVSDDGRYLFSWNDNDKGSVIDAQTGSLVGEAVDSYYGAFTPDAGVWSAWKSYEDAGTIITLRNVGDTTATQIIKIPPGAWSIAPDLSTYATTDPDLRGITVRDSRTAAVVRNIAAPADTMSLDLWQFGGHLVVAVDHVGIFDPLDQQAFIDAYYGPVVLDFYPTDATEPSASISVPTQNFSIDKNQDAVAVDEGNGSVGVYELPAGTRRAFTVTHDNLVGLTLSPDGAVLITSGDDKLLRVWDANTGQLLETLAGHNGRVFKPAISNAGDQLTAWSVGLDNQVIEWDLTGDRRIDRPFRVTRGDALIDGTLVLAISVSPDGSFLATTGTNGSIDIVDTHTLDVVRQVALEGSDEKAVALAFSPDGTTLVVGGQGPTQLQRFDTSTWSPLGSPLTGFAATVGPPKDAGPGAPAQSANPVRAVAYSPDGATIAAGSQDGTIRFWNADTGAPVGVVINANAPVWSIAFSPDGGRIAATYREEVPVAGMAAVWDVSDGTRLYAMNVDDDYGVPRTIVFTHDGKTLATGGGIGFVRFWDAATGQQFGAPILADAGELASLAFTDDDKALFAAGTDGTVRVLDPVGRSQLGSALPGGAVNSIATIGPDGRVYVAYQDDGHGYVWDVSLDSMETFACSVPDRTLTKEEWQRYLPNRPYEPACRARQGATDVMSP